MNNKLSQEQLEELIINSKTSARKRAVKIFQDDSYPGPHLGLNVIQPESYVRPHLRYSDEHIMHHSGELCQLLFDSEGKIIGKDFLTAATPYLFVPKETYQSIISLKPNSAIWFVVQGPHNPAHFSRYLESAPEEKGDYQGYFSWLKKEAGLNETPK